MQMATIRDLLGAIQRPRGWEASFMDCLKCKKILNLEEKKLRNSDYFQTERAGYLCIIIREYSNLYQNSWFSKYPYSNSLILKRQSQATFLAFPPNVHLPRCLGEGEKIAVRIWKSMTNGSEIMNDDKLYMTVLTLAW